MSEGVPRAWGVAHPPRCTDYEVTGLGELLGVGAELGATRGDGLGGGRMIGVKGGDRVGDGLGDDVGRGV